MTIRNVEALMFGAGRGDRPFPGAPFPGTDRLYPSPGIHHARGYSVSKDGFHFWVFGESTGMGDILTKDPNGPIYQDKHFVIRSLKIWSSGPGYFYIRNKEDGVGWGASQPVMKWRVVSGVPMDLVFGVDGVDIGDRTYFEWVGDGPNNTIYASLVYDIESA